MKIAATFAAIVTAPKYPELAWHSFAKAPGADWVYLGALSEMGAAETCATIRRKGGQAFQAHTEFLGVTGVRAIRAKVAHILQQLNSSENDNGE